TSLKKLSDSLHDIFKQRGTLFDLDEALKLHRAVLVLAPPGHPDQFDFLHHLANSLRAIFEQRGALSDLDEAIKLHRAALTRPSGNYARSVSLNNLDITIFLQIEQQYTSSGLDEAIVTHGDLVDVITHANRP
ncbi:hypothetical protein DFJ58DRAFT_662193, partial [Suillus subalutaceus]|uniref:uncharacterized protein n=1 Tax=Suillus subalutaceus TaxID=48586 RepID=UPI001B87C17F